MVLTGEIVEATLEHLLLAYTALALGNSFCGPTDLLFPI